MEFPQFSEPGFTIVARKSSDGSAARIKLNSQVMTYYAIGLSILIGIFIVGHWLRRLAGRASQSKALYPITALTRIFRRFALRNLFGFSSSGHAAVVFIYVALNILFTFWNVDYKKIENLSSRMGWLATSNFVLVVFLALKNTPLAFLTAYSYERLNCLHKIVGYTILGFVVLHASIYTYYDLHAGKISTLWESKTHAGIIGAFAFLTTVITASSMRRMQYELFYVIHVTMFMITTICISLHRKKFKDRILILTFLSTSMWFADHLLRIGRLAYNFVNNDATVYPLPNGGTRVVFKKPLSRAKPGKHCYLWLPQIRPFETHPFTIVATEPLELVIQTRDGFTKALYDYASANPGGKLRASVDGPYGTFPDPTAYDRVVLVAGGAGATFTLGLATNMIQRIAPDSNTKVDFIWVVRDRDNVSWFTRYLRDIISHECAHKVQMKLHLTQISNTTTSTTTNASSPTPSSASLSEKQLETSTPSSPVEPSEKDLEAAMTTARVRDYDLNTTTTTTIDGLNLPITYGRPDIEACVRDAIASLPADQKILIAACGPTGLVDCIRDTAARCIRADGPSVELHCEQFGW